MDSSNLSEDGMSERIRYSQGSGQNDSIKDYIWTTLPSDQVIYSACQCPTISNV